MISSYFLQLIRAYFHTKGKLKQLHKFAGTSCAHDGPMTETFTFLHLKNLLFLFLSVRGQYFLWYGTYFGYTHLTPPLEKISNSRVQTLSTPFLWANIWTKFINIFRATLLLGTLNEKSIKKHLILKIAVGHVHCTAWQDTAQVVLYLTLIQLVVCDKKNKLAGLIYQLILAYCRCVISIYMAGDKQQGIAQQKDMFMRLYKEFISDNKLIVFKFFLSLKYWSWYQPWNSSISCVIVLTE